MKRKAEADVDILWKEYLQSSINKNKSDIELNESTIKKNNSDLEMNEIQKNYLKLKVEKIMKEIQNMDKKN